MKSHVWRPLYLVLGIVAAVLIARLFLVPEGFGVHERGYMYGFYRKANENEWKSLAAKYKTSAYCRDCHADKVARLKDSFHAAIQCENCHGPAGDHPGDPPKLEIDRSRELCLRCHAYLPYAASGRSKITGIDPEMHNAGRECTTCHDAHNPKREATR
jgi:predicted CXXCH cytochrome family protein